MKATEYEQISHEMETILAAMFANDGYSGSFDYVYYEDMPLYSTYGYQRHVNNQRERVKLTVSGKPIAIIQKAPHPMIALIESTNYPESQYLNILNKLMVNYPEVQKVNEL